MHVQDLGGADNISEAERAILRRACVLMIELERLEQRFAEGEADAATIDLYQRGANSMRRLLESTGLKRRAREVNGVKASDFAVPMRSQMPCPPYTFSALNSIRF